VIKGIQTKATNKAYSTLERRLKSDLIAMPTVLETVHHLIESEDDASDIEELSSHNLQKRNEGVPMVQVIPDDPDEQTQQDTVEEQADIVEEQRR
jgi:hypothetical protein